MVLLRSLVFLERCCPRYYQMKNIIYFQRKTSMQFSTTSKRSIRKKWDEKPKIEPLTPQIEGIKVEVHDLKLSNLTKPFFFTVAFSSASFGAAAIWQYEKIRARSKNLVDWFHERNHKYGSWRNSAKRWWNSLSDGEKIFVPICFANILVFLAWRVPALQIAMVRYFSSNPAAANNCWPMVLSAFSHYSTFHIFANMYVLHSFSTGASMSLGKEHFLGFYMAAAAISSYASYVHKVLANRPGLSLGASGAIMAVLGYTCTSYPDLQLSIILLPFFTFKAAIAIKVIMGLDLAGIILGWKLFDHAAHLGGAAFGVFWSVYGASHLWPKREILLKQWHALRGPKE